MSAPEHRTVHATGATESRELRLSKQPDGSYRIVIWWNRGNKALATLNFDETEWDKLVTAVTELKANG